MWENLQVCDFATRAPIRRGVKSLELVGWLNKITKKYEMVCMIELSDI